jgi:hypothetical protein
VSRRLTLAACCFASCLAASLAAAGVASASQLIDRNAQNVRLEVNSKEEALLSYTAGGKQRHVLVWGAVDARQSSQGGHQVRFQLDYSGGWGKYHHRYAAYWKTFKNACRAYDGPALAFFVAGCKAPDGSYWALQSWQTPLPDLGFAPWLPQLSAYELHISHWTGPLAQLQVWTDWIYGGRFHDLFGKATYLGQPIYGFHTTNYGAPLDGFGRLIYLDTLNAPAYGSGWRRENSFVTHNPTGVFCYGFYTFDPTHGGYIHPPGLTSVRGPGVGTEYRITMEGPGVTPDVTTTIADPGNYDPSDPAKVAYERQQNALLDTFGDKLCRQH